MLRTGLAKALFGAALLWSATASAQQAWTTGQVNVRAGPDSTYPAVLLLAPGYPVDVAGCLADYSWCDVVFNNGYDRGWVPSRRLQYAWQGRRVPLYDYRASFGLPIVTFSLLNYWDSYYHNRSWYGDRARWYGAPHSNWSNDWHGHPPQGQYRQPPRVEGNQYHPSAPQSRPYEQGHRDAYNRPAQPVYREGQNRPPEPQGHPGYQGGQRPMGPQANPGAREGQNYRGPQPQAQAAQPVPAQPVPGPQAAPQHPAQPHPQGAEGRPGRGEGPRPQQP